MLDYGSHAVMASWFMLGFDKQPREVRALRIGVKERTRFFNGKAREIEVDDDAHFKILYRDPQSGDWASVVLEATWAYPELGSNSSDTRGHLVVRGSEGEMTGYFDEAGQEYVRIRRYTGGEHVFPIPSYASEERSFAEEISNFCHCVREGRMPALNAELAAVTIKMINAAQYSQMLGRRAVTLVDFEAYAEGFAQADILAGGDALVAALNAPHRLPR